MLHKLSLSNYALADRLELELGDGLNIFTGETGAGKSILIGAIAALLGEKAAFNPQREAETKAVIEGLFVNCTQPQINALLRQHEIDIAEDHSLLVRREFHPTGRSRVFVNDTPVATTILEELADLLADLHGQHEHQSLLRPKTHLRFLDSFAGLDGLREQVARAWEEARTLRGQYQDLLNRQQEIKARAEIEVFQLQEIKQINPQLGEEEKLEADIRLLGHAEQRAELAGRLVTLLAESEHAVQVHLRAAAEALADLTAIDAGLARLLADFRAAEVTIHETAVEMQSYQARIEFDSARLEQARQRLAELQRLKRKYGGTLAEVVAHLEKLERALAEFENFDATLAELAERRQAAERVCAELCLQLSEKRRQAGRELERAVPEVLKELGLPAAKFAVRLEYQPQPDGFVEVEQQQVRATRDGIDVVEFDISTNPGQPPAPLAKVASGGEISRIMLALKSILAERDDIPILIFDEIDSGVSGRVAQAVGRRLQKLALSHQILCITHLPQIASTGSHHFLVEKKVRKDRTQTSVRRLAAPERVNAIASLLGGEKITATHLKSAQELLAEAGNPVSQQ
ncbi:DNA repair protein RecN [candidate division KSB1 bacterium]|nr:DNA repair protein RecN [bacterium]NUM67110.1 DNA repair protein RecN [candidate division KSB1 bacterium]